MVLRAFRGACVLSCARNAVDRNSVGARNLGGPHSKFALFFLPTGALAVAIFEILFLIRFYCVGCSLVHGSILANPAAREGNVRFYMCPVGKFIFSLWPAIIIVVVAFFRSRFLAQILWTCDAGDRDSRVISHVSFFNGT